MDLKVGLEISLRNRREGVYSIELRYSEPDSEADIRMGPSEKTDIHLDLARLQFQIFDTDAYARILTHSFFADEAVRTMFARARSVAERLNRPLSVRLLIDEDSPELQSVYWELLRDPGDDSALFSGENIYFSRYLSSTTWRKVRLHARAKLRALVMVANPEDLGDYQGMEPIPVDAEIERARQALGDIPITLLGGGGERASLKNLIGRLQAEKPDILYLVCHGAIKAGQPYLWLENAEGKTAVISGIEIVAQIQGLTSLPILVVLASCQSAGHPDEPEFRTALGPRLAQAGVPAIVAMQGNISQATVAEFMPVFFESLQKHGEVDRAMSLARGRVRERPDFWMPVLFTRLRSGAIYAEPEPAARAVRFGWKNWSLLAGLMLLVTVIPVLLLVPSTGNRLRADLPWLRCVWPLPVEPVRGIKVAVAEFSMPDNLPASIDVRNLRRRINSYIKELTNVTGSVLYCPVDGEPATLAGRIGADILVYGDLSRDGGSWVVQPRFYVHPHLSGADELTGEEVFGQKISLGGDLSDTPEVTRVIDKQLSKPFATLRTFLDGLISYKTGYFQDARTKFNQVLADWPYDDPATGAQTGQEIVYLWLGNTYLPRPASSSAVQQVDALECAELEALALDGSAPDNLTMPDQDTLDDLPSGYRCAWSAYLAGLQGPAPSRRLFLAMGNWWAELPPMVVFGKPQLKCYDYDAALGYYQEATRQGTESPSAALIELKASINLGLLNFLAAIDSCDEPRRLYMQARDILLQAYEQSLELENDGELENSAEVNNLRAKAALHLGRAHKYLDEHQDAINAFNLALAVTGGGYIDGEPPWQHQIRWESYNQRGYLFIQLAEAGDTSSWQRALQDFDAVISAFEAALPVEPVYAMDAYDGKAKILHATGNGDESAQMCRQFQDLLRKEGNTGLFESAWCNH